MIGRRVAHRPHLSVLYKCHFPRFCIRYLRDNGVGLNMAGIKSFYDITTKTLTGEEFKFSSLQGKVVLIENVASLWGTTSRDYTQMNELHERFSDKGLVILGVPCNQFGYQVRGLTVNSLFDSIALHCRTGACGALVLSSPAVLHLFYAWWFICIK